VKVSQYYIKVRCYMLFLLTLLQNFVLKLYSYLITDVANFVCVIGALVT